MTSYALMSGSYASSLINGTADDICSYLNCPCATTSSPMSLVPILLGVGLLLLVGSANKKK